MSRKLSAARKIALRLGEMTGKLKKTDDMQLIKLAEDSERVMVEVMNIRNALTNLNVGLLEFGVLFSRASSSFRGGFESIGVESLRREMKSYERVATYISDEVSGSHILIHHCTQSVTCCVDIPPLYVR